MVSSFPSVSSSKWFFKETKDKYINMCQQHSLPPEASVSSWTSAWHFCILLLFCLAYKQMAQLASLTSHLSPYSNVVFEPTVAASPGDFPEMKILRPHRRVLQQKLWRWGPAVCVLTRLPGDSDTCWSLRTTTLENVYTHVFLSQCMCSLAHGVSNLLCMFAVVLENPLYTF